MRGVRHCDHDCRIEGASHRAAILKVHAANHHQWAAHITASLTDISFGTALGGIVSLEIAVKTTKSQHSMNTNNCHVHASCRCRSMHHRPLHLPLNTQSVTHNQTIGEQQCCTASWTSLPALPDVYVFGTHQTASSARSVMCSHQFAAGGSITLLRRR